MADPIPRLLDLLHTEGRPLHALLTRLTLDPHAAEDLMQDLFLKLAANPAFAAAKNPGAYLRQSAIHLALDWRKRKRPAANTNLPEPCDPAPLPGVAAATHEQWSHILDIAADLPPATREAFVLHYIHQLPFNEIAAAMDKTPHQVRGLCHKAISALRSKLRISDEEACRASE